MRITRFIPLLAVSVLLISCDRQPVAPDQEVGPLFQATHEEFAGPFINNGTIFVECANDGVGEDVNFINSGTWVESHTTSNSGNKNIQHEVIYDPNFQLVGLTSGDVWILYHYTFASHQNFHGSGESRQQVLNGFFENQDGDRLHLMLNFHWTNDANGNPKLFRYDAWCPGK